MTRTLLDALADDRLLGASPAFKDLLPYDSDGHLRQALVLCWMMLPRAGGRDFGDVRKTVARIYERSVEAWESDNRTFTKAPARKSGKTGRSRKPASKKRKTVKC